MLFKQRKEEKMDYFLLLGTKLFEGLSSEDVKTMCECLQYKVKKHKKGEVIFSAGQKNVQLALVVSGSVIIENNDFWGNNNILNYIGAGETFAETYACLPEKPMIINAISAEDSEIIFFDVEKVLKSCGSGCMYHGTIIRNLLNICAFKNLNLTSKIFHISPKSMRGKIIAYLSDFATESGKTQFDIPFNREQLANYLQVDRSALSAELGKMKKDGLIYYEKNHFILKSNVDF